MPRLFASLPLPAFAGAANIQAEISSLGKPVLVKRGIAAVDGPSRPYKKRQAWLKGEAQHTARGHVNPAFGAGSAWYNPRE